MGRRKLGTGLHKNKLLHAQFNRRMKNIRRLNQEIIENAKTIQTQSEETKNTQTVAEAK